MSSGQDPTQALTHFAGFGPLDNRVVCLVDGGKSLPQNVTLRRAVGQGQGLVPLSKLAPWGLARSEVSAWV